MSKKTRGPGRWRAIAAIVFLLLGLVVVFNFQAIQLVGAILLSEKRPALLKDAEWNAPSSAVRFGQRFAPGKPESDLTDWLSREGFDVEADQRTAEHLVAALPCNERIVVAWTVGGDRKIRTAEAEVIEAGCL